MNAIRNLRETLGLTQAQLAASAGTSQSAIAAYEIGAKSPTLRTLERIAAAARCHVEVKYFPPLTREDRRSLALHNTIASRLRESPDVVIAGARKSLARMRALHPGARPLLDEWRVLLRRPLDALIPVLSDASPWARELRHVTPFTGILSAAERADVYREFALAERALTTDAIAGRSEHHNERSVRTRLRAAGAIHEVSELLVIGSQAVHGSIRRLRPHSTRGPLTIEYQ